MHHPHDILVPMEPRDVHNVEYIDGVRRLLLRMVLLHDDDDCCASSSKIAPKLPHCDRVVREQHFLSIVPKPVLMLLLMKRWT